MSLKTNMFHIVTVTCLILSTHTGGALAAGGVTPIAAPIIVVHSCPSGKVYYCAPGTGINNCVCMSKSDLPDKK